MRTVFVSLLFAAALTACGQSPEPEAPAGEPAVPSLALQLASPSQLAVPEGSPIRVSAAADGLRIEGRNPSAESNLTTGGASVAVGPANEAAFAGNTVRVTIRARGVDGATQFEAAYSTNGSGNSGWQELAVTDQLTDVSFDFAVPPIIEPLDDFVGINPPAQGALEVQSIRVDIVAPASPPTEQTDLRQ
jgi:hypothetical protein